MFGFLKKIMSKINESKKNDIDISVVAKCPKCNAEVLEVGEHWACVNTLTKTCNFRMKNTLEGEKIDINLLINFQKLKQYEYLISVINEEVKKEELRLKNDESKDYKELDSSCGNCGTRISRFNDNTVRCHNKKCGFTVEASFMGITFSDEQISEIMTRHISHEYDFINSKGNVVRGRAVLELDDNFNLTSKYRLVTDISKLPKKYFKFISAPEKDGNIRIPLDTLLK